MRKLIIFIFLFCCISCKDQEIEQKLCLAENMLREHPAEVLCMLDSIDISELNSDSQRAHYALLYSKAQYQNYVVPSNDTLITLAVDYYEKEGCKEERFYGYLYQGLVRYQLQAYDEASWSLLRASAYSSHIGDHYAKGQMYGNLSLINQILHCSDASEYARKSYLEFCAGGLEGYAASALVLLASCHLQKQQYDSCRLLLDEAITEAKRLSNNFIQSEAYSLKAQYAICVDSVCLAESLLQKLQEQKDYVFNLRDIATLATIHASRGEEDLARQYLLAIRQECYNLNDSIQYHTNSYWINKILGNEHETSLYQDTLLYLAEKLLSEGAKHTSIASQKEYAEWNLTNEKHRTREQTIIIIGLVLLIAAIVSLSFALWRKREIEIRLLKKTIENQQYEKERHLQEYEQALMELRSDAFVQQVREAVHRSTGLSQAELYQLSILFQKRLPYFEHSLRELITLSDTEWHICMLLKISCKPGDIAILLNKTPGAISSARIRMYDKVFHKKGHTNDWDDFINSL